jgi:hypothetical protein
MQYTLYKFILVSFKLCNFINFFIHILDINMNKKILRDFNKSKNLFLIYMLCSIFKNFVKKIKYFLNYYFIFFR